MGELFGGDDGAAFRGVGEGNPLIINLIAFGNGFCDIDDDLASFS